MPFDIPVYCPLFLLPSPVTEIPAQKSGCIWREIGPFSCNLHNETDRWSLTIFSSTSSASRGCLWWYGKLLPWEGEPCFSISSASKFILISSTTCERANPPQITYRLWVSAQFYTIVVLSSLPTIGVSGGWSRLTNSFRFSATTEVLSAHFGWTSEQKPHGYVRVICSSTWIWLWCPIRCRHHSH